MAGFRSRSSIRRTDRRVDHHYEGSAVFSYIQARTERARGPKNLRAFAGRMRRAQTFRTYWVSRLRCVLLGASVQDLENCLPFVSRARRGWQISLGSGSACVQDAHRGGVVPHRFAGRNCRPAHAGRGRSDGALRDAMARGAQELRCSCRPVWPVDMASEREPPGGRRPGASGAAGTQIEISFGGSAYRHRCI